MVVLRECLLHECAVGAELVQRGLRALDPIELDDLARAGPHGGEVLRAAERSRLACANPDHSLGSRHAAKRLLDRDRDRRVVVLRRDGIVRRPELVDGAEEAGADAGGQHRDERHESEPDHQRRRGRTGALRVTAGVVTGEQPRRPAELRAWGADRRSKRDDEVGREQRHAEEDEQRADAHEEEDLRGREVRAEEAERERCESEERKQGGPDAPVPREPPRRQRRTLPDGCDRRDAGRAERRAKAGDDRDDDPDEQRDDDRPRLEQEAAVRQREAE